MEEKILTIDEIDALGEAHTKAMSTPVKDIKRIKKMKNKSKKVKQGDSVGLAESGLSAIFGNKKRHQNMQKMMKK